MRRRDPRSPARWGGCSRPRSRGSGTGRRGRSSYDLQRAGVLLAPQRHVVGASHPTCERLPVQALLEIGLHHVADVVAEPVAGDLVRTQLLAERRVEPEATAEVHLVALDLAA